MVPQSFFRAAVFAILCLTSLGQSQAAVQEFLHYNFDGETPGSQVTVTTTTTPYPQSHPYATGGFPNVGSHTGTAIIGSPSGFSNAVVLSTNQAGTGANWLDTQFLVNDNVITLEFDLAILASPSSTSQATASAPNGQVFAINAFNNNSVPTWRFAATPTSATGGRFGMRQGNTPAYDLNLFADYQLGEKYHIAIVADYLSNTVDVSIDGILALNDHAFVNNGPGMSEFFFFQNGSEGNMNSVALDNIVGSTGIAAVPEPGTFTIFAVGLASFAAFRRRLSGKTRRTPCA